MKPSRLSATIDLTAEGKHCGFLRLPHSVHRSAYGWLPIPVVSIKNGKGPKVICLGGIHGDEWEGQLTWMKLIRELTPDRVRGQLLILSSANFPAAMSATRVSPIDDINLNRAFPGDPDGMPTQQIAYYIESVLMPGADLVIDLHSGGSSLMYIPSTLSRFTDDKAAMAKSIEVHKAFGASIAYITDAPQGEDRTTSAGAGRKGVAYLGTELGGAGTLSHNSIEVAEGGVRRVLGKIGSLPEAANEKPPRQTRVLRVEGVDYYVYAPDSGIFEPLVELGAEVRPGQPAARIHFPDTPWREPTTCHFEQEGVVICQRFPSRCERGDCLYHLGSDWAA